MILASNKPRPLAIDLFAGAGGLSLAFEQAGFEIAAAVEIDPIHCATHEFNFPNTTTICASVTDLTGSQIRQLAGLGERDIDVVMGGAPCQGFSMMGKRALDDPRNQLVGHYVRLVKELNPKYCVFENVRGLTLGKHARFLDELIAALHAAGYKVLLPYQVLNAADFGVPQDRRRLFLMAARCDLQLPEYPAMSSERTSVWSAIGDLPDADSYEELLDSDTLEIRWASPLTYAKVMRCLEVDASDYAYPRKFAPFLLTSSLRTKHSDASRQRFLATPSGQAESVSRFHKLDPNGVCNTLRAGTDSARGAFTSPRPIHPFLPRVITVREAARLHSYPDWFRFHKTKWHGFRQIGNSVPPLLGRAVARQIIAVLGVVPTKPQREVALGNELLLSVDMAEAARRFKVPRNVIAQRTRPTVKARAETLELRYG